jgi:uncharacterized membrane protein
MGGKLADKLSDVVGSWTYIGIQTAIFAVWVALNVSAPKQMRNDPYPFSFLNLMVGFMSAYTGPVLLMAANRQSDKDREKILESLALDQKTEKLTQHLDEHVHSILVALERVERGSACLMGKGEDAPPGPDML